MVLSTGESEFKCDSGYYCTYDGIAPAEEDEVQRNDSQACTCSYLGM